MAQEESLSPFCSHVYGVFGQPDILPRVSEEYQAEIPSLMSASDYRISHDDKESEYIPIMWVNDGVTNESDNIAVPESSSDPWNEIEQAGFTLGLYIFEKKFVQVKKFVGSKDMKDILSFYYGKFYKSDVYERWCECWKIRSKKCCNWQKLFSTRSRQRDLVSRLQPNVAEDCYNKLLQVSEAFLEGEMGLEDYVFTLKDLVGMKALVEAAGIGGEKVGELRSLPDEVLKASTVECGPNNEVISEQQKNEAGIVDKGVSSDMNGIEISTNLLLAVKKRGRTLNRNVNTNGSSIVREPVPITSSSGTMDQHENPQLRTVCIDINVPVLQEVGADEPLVTAVVERQQTNAGKESDDSNVETILEAVDHSTHQLDMNAKRKSSRNTQQKIKVLEALAAGLRDMKEKRRRKVDLLDNLMPRRSQRTRLIAGETSQDGVPVPPDFRNEETTIVGCDGSGHGNSNSNVICSGD